MVDETKPTAAPNPAAVVSNPNPAASQNNPNASQDAATKDAMANNPATQRAAAEQSASDKRVQRSSTLVTNPAPVDEAGAEREVPPEERALPQSTIDEMNAGKAALERNKPVARALEQKREA